MLEKLEKLGQVVFEDAGFCMIQMWLGQQIRRQLPSEVCGTSLVVQWLRHCTSSEGNQVRSVVRDLDPTCHS